MMTLSIAVIFGMLGLAVDLGWAYYRQQTAQSAADAAALAAARAALNAAPSGPVCSQSGVWCGAVSNCPSTAPGSPSSTFDNACMLAAANGFTTSGIDTVSVQANTTNPIPTVSGPTVGYWATARVSESLPALFGMVQARGGFTPGARSPPRPCSSAAARASWHFNPAPVPVSPRPVRQLQPTTAMSMSIRATLRPLLPSRAAASAPVQARPRWSGGTSAGTTFTPAAMTGQPVLPDPFASMQPPAVGACTDGSSISFAGGTNTIYPGVSCHVISGAGGSRTFSPGLYILKAGLSVAGTTIVANQVTIYIQGGGISMAGPTVTLSPRATGAWTGVAIFEDHGNSSPISLAGATNTINGLIYTPMANLTVAGGSGDQVSLICNSFIAAGNFSITGGSAQTSLGGSVSLVQ